MKVKNKLELNESKFWWLNCNPLYWKPLDKEIGWTQAYTTHNEEGIKRRVYSNFVKAMEGDLVIGYITSPVKKLGVLLRVSKPIHLNFDGKEIIEFKKIRNLKPISWNELKQIESLRGMKPFVSNQGSLFELTEDEFSTLVAF